MQELGVRMYVHRYSFWPFFPSNDQGLKVSKEDRQILRIILSLFLSFLSTLSFHKRKRPRELPICSTERQ